MSMIIPKWLGARDEPLHVAIQGDLAPWKWPADWFEHYVNAHVYKPERPLAETLYPEYRSIKEVKTK